MSITAHVQNFRGISAATLDISRICLVAAPNGGGKSSICLAVAAAATGEAIPYRDESGNALVKSKAGVLVRGGTPSGRAQITADTGTAEVAWPAAKVTTTGQPPCCSVHAAGIESIVTMDAKKRTAFLIQYLGAQPTKDNLAAALADLNLGDSMVDKLWELIELQGWDGAHSQIKDKGARLKGQWEQITNDNYGAKKAESWIPQGYSSDLMGASADNLQAMVTDAKDALEAAIASSAIDNVRRAELQEFAATLPAKQAALDKAKEPLPEDAALKDVTEQMSALKKEGTAAWEILESLRKSAPKTGEQPKKLFCSCGKELMLDPAGNLCDYAVGGPAQAEIDVHAKKISDQVKVVNELAKKVQPVEAKYNELSAVRQKAVDDWNAAITLAVKAVSEAREAAEEVERMPEGGNGGADVDACRNDLAVHELRLKAFVAKNAADGLHRSIEMNQSLLAHIAPSGVRAQVLQTALGSFNATLAGFSTTATWPVVQIEQDFSFSFQSVPYYLCSGGEQYRVRTTMQVAMASREQAGLVICDGADILDKAGRNGLFKLLKGCGIPALVGMTILDGEAAVPALAKAGYGISYWIDGAVAREVVA